MHASPASGGRRLTLGRAAVLGALTGVLLIAAVAALTGGFEAAAEKGPPHFTVGQQIDMERYQVRVEKAVVRTKKGYEFKDGTVPFLDVAFTVTNTSSSTAKLDYDIGDDPFTGAPLVTGHPPERETSVLIEGHRLIAAAAYTGRTKTELLQPGLPTLVVLTFELPGGRPPAQPLKLTFGSFEDHAEAFTGAHSWLLIRDEDDRRKAVPIGRSELRYETVTRP
ncbi:MAG: hypothetical protein GEV11_08485 [Streptosporangiales bacterium]|nr:hypothetical protein [Streptosporangiales bacterium]